MKSSRSVILAAATALLFFYACNRPGKDRLETPAYNPMIAAFTSGIISSESTVKVRFAEPVADSVEVNSTVDKGIMTLDPPVDGTVYFIDRQTIGFRPDGRFRQGTAYDVRVRLDKLFPNTTTSTTFDFRFHTIEQHLGIELEGFRPYNDYAPEMNYLTARLTTADIADPEAVREVIGVVQEGHELPVRWEHGPDGKVHQFTIDSIRRGDTELVVEIRHDGQAISSAQQGKEIFELPALGDFKVISHRLVQYPEQHVLLSFSDPLRKDQSLNGLIRLSNDTDMRFIVEGNMVRAYPNVRQSGSRTLFVEPGIRNTAGKGLVTGQSFEIIFEEIKPSVELLGNGVIIPTADEVKLPFKAVNLRAVDLKVIRIYEDNIAQFLQVNQLDGNRELKRAGRLILKKTISLVADQPVNYGQWNTFSLNLTELVKTEPGAIYRVELNFRQIHSMYACKDEPPAALPEPEDNYDGIEEEDLSYWDSYENYYSDWDYYDYEGYNWEDREDPCKPAYYGNRRAVSRNILSSNMGLIAKYGAGEQLHVTVTDLLQATAVSGATVKVYNFQQQLLAEAPTNNSGMTTIDLDARPFLVVAEQGGQKGYLRMVDGAALSYSMFDISGTVVQKGIKGFLYSERGVWRPGDSIYINLVLNDSENPLPEGHPVAFELKDPQGKIVKRNIAPGNTTGFYPFHTRTATNAPTGRYTVTALAGGVTFTKGLQVETIKPNRLRIALSFEQGDTICPEKGPVTGTLSGEWLTGATASGLRAELEVLLRSANTAFKGYEAYTFSDPTKKIDRPGTTFWEGNTDQSGQARFSRQLNIGGEAPGMLHAIFTTRLFERSGEFSIDQKTVTCSPYNTYVGIKTPPGDKQGMLLTDTAHTVDVVTLDTEGNPVEKPGLEVKVYNLSWRWWWDASFENLASYMGSSSMAPVYETTINTKKGSGKFNFRIDYPEWGRYLVMVRDQGGHSAAKIVYVDWPGWAGRAGKGDPDAASVLAFSSDKTTYTVGETALVTIPSSAKGRILVSLENGSGVLRQEWIETSGSETKYQLEITPEMTPNIYVFASLIQPHGHAENDLPIRMFGVIPVKVEDPATRLYPQLEMPDELRPESTVRIEVTEKYNKKMTYTIAMVDEGLLDLTRFRTPDPWAAFFAREALGVKTWDMFDQVLGAFGGRIDGIYSIGGGMDESGAGAKDANRFPPMVEFIGPFTLDGKRNVHEITVPNYIGSVRTMLIAGNNKAYGHMEKTTPVKQPLMLLATLPRVLGPGEQVALPVNVFVMEEGIGQVELEISTNDMLISAEKKKTVAFSETGDKIIGFILKTPEKTGVGKVHIEAVSGRHRASYNIELNIRSSNPPVTSFITAAVEPSETFSKEFDYVGMPGTNELMLEVSNIPPIDFGRRLKNLLRYPHGCVEQVTSAAFPQLFLGDVVELTETAAKKAENNVRQAITSLTAFQLSDGGFSYWPGSVKASDWGTSYAGHFLLEAKEKGFGVSEAVLQNWKRYQRKAARRWSIAGSTNIYEIRQEQLLQACRLFTLALAGDAEIGSMNRLRERTDLLPEAKWRLAAAYALSGQKETARELVTNVPTQVEEYYDSRYTFGSRTRDQAMILEAMILIGMKENGLLLLEQVAEQLSSRKWMNTQATAYSLMAVAKYTGGRTSDDRLAFTYAFNNEARKKAETGLPLAQVAFDPGDAEKGKFEVENQTEGIMFVSIINTGLPKPGEEQAMENSLRVQVYYADMENNRISPEKIPQGTDFRAVYRVYNPGTMGTLDNVALTTIFPPGWEIHNERMFSTAGSDESFTYQDIRDDRVMTYFSLPPNTSKTFSIRLNAAYEGRYYLPSVKVGEMYKNDVQAVVPGRWIEVPARN
ncbi:MAG: MG2 domain-containing protein [Bacteroidales bacterium]|nr:MG2 domain-containing protein [Bacteroidales bacterium]